MKVFVNLTSISYPMTGIGHYTFNLTKRLLESRSIEQLAGMHQGNLLNHSQIEQLLESHPALSHKSTFGGFIRNVTATIPFARPAYYAYKAHRLKQQQTKLREFIYWEPNFIALPYPGVTVTTIHDLSHVVHPEFHPAHRVSVLNHRLPASIGRSSRIVTVSTASKTEIEHLFHPECEIDIIPPGVSNTFRSVTALQIQTCRQTYRLPPRFILSVATLEPRKNLSRIVEAFELLPMSIQQQFPLVICGTKGWHSHPIYKKITKLQHKGLAHCLGYVAQEHLPALYTAATLSVYVSLYEGFGMPVAESMAAGTPVLTSSVSSMPEVAGDAAMLVAPDDTLAISKALRTLLEDDKLRERLARKGQQHAQQFTWQHSCDRLIHAFEAAQASNLPERPEGAQT